MARKNKTIHPVTQYAQDIVSGVIISNKWVRLACERHIKDQKDGEKRGLYFDECAANHIIDFYEEFLVFYEGNFDGKPFILTPHQKFIVGSIFGWKRKDGFRRFRTAYIEESKGQGKSPLAGGVGLYALVFDNEPGAEIYAAAVTREQAGICFRDARTFAEKSEELSGLLKVDKNNIAYIAENSFFRPVSSEHRGLDGKRPHVVLIDEIHEHPNDMVVRKMSAGTKTRRQALIFEITNSGYDRHSICFQHHEYTEKILEGLIQDDAWFGIMTGLDVCSKCEAEGKTMPQDGCSDCDDWRDENVWEKANPNLKYLGAPFRDYLRRQVDEAKSMPAQENIVKRLNFCLWTESITKWIPTDAWSACGSQVDIEDLKGRICYGGLDLSSNADLTAWVLVFPPEITYEYDNILNEHQPVIQKGGYKVLCRFFLPEDNMMQRVRKDKVPYDVWVRQGFITTTPGNIIDYDFILAQIQKDMADYQILELAFDRWGSQKITTDLQDIGFEIEGKRNLIQFGQGFASMAAPTKEVETMVLKGEIAHGNNPVLSWMVSNVAIKMDPAGNMKPDKEKSTERIDGAVALIMAVGRAMLRKGENKSAYDGMTADEMKARMGL
jgi:phage terminase large subunit-like protein